MTVGSSATRSSARTGEPWLKVQDFDAKMRSGLGRRVDVAMMKFCYVDVTADTDVDALFATYRETMAALRHDFPEVTFIYVTVPLTTESLLSQLKSRITGSKGYGAADNAARERLNALIRRAVRRRTTSSTWRRSSPPRPMAAVLSVPTRGSGTTG